MIEESKKELIDFMQKSAKSQNQISKEIGLSTSVLSQFLKGTYGGDNENVAIKIVQYLRVAQERLQNECITTYNLKTYNTQHVIFAVSYAHQYSKIGLIHGDAGAGKTEALKYYVKNNPGVIMVTANASCKTSKAILYRIASQMGLQASGNEAFIMELLVEYLKDTSKLIIIDEADHLTLNAMQAVRNLNDLCQIGIVFSGNDVLLFQMYNRNNSNFGRFRQLRSRIGIQTKVENSNFALADLRVIFSTLNDTCLKILLQITQKESLRVAINVTEYATMLANGMNEPLSAKHIDSAYKKTLE